MDFNSFKNAIDKYFLKYLRKINFGDFLNKTVQFADKYFTSKENFKNFLKQYKGILFIIFALIIGLIYAQVAEPIKTAFRNENLKHIYVIVAGDYSTQNICAETLVKLVGKENVNIQQQYLTNLRNKKENELKKDKTFRKDGSEAETKHQRELKQKAMEIKLDKLDFIPKDTKWLLVINSNNIILEENVINVIINANQKLKEYNKKPLIILRVSAYDKFKSKRALSGFLIYYPKLKENDLKILANSYAENRLYNNLKEKEEALNLKAPSDYVIGFSNFFLSPKDLMEYAISKNKRNKIQLAENKQDYQKKAETDDDYKYMLKGIEAIEKNKTSVEDLEKEFPNEYKNTRTSYSQTKYLEILENYKKLWFPAEKKEKKYIKG